MNRYEESVRAEDAVANVFFDRELCCVISSFESSCLLILNGELRFANGFEAFYGAARGRARSDNQSYHSALRHTIWKATLVTKFPNQLSKRRSLFRMRLRHDTKLLLPTKFFFSAFDIEKHEKKYKTLQTDMLKPYL